MFTIFAFITRDELKIDARSRLKNISVDCAAAAAAAASGRGRLEKLKKRNIAGETLEHRGNNKKFINITFGTVVADG